MNILLIGGAGNLAKQLITKFNKEGHHVYVITGSKYKAGSNYGKVFEKFLFTYDSSCLAEIFESVNPEVTIYLGAFDTTFDWGDDKRDAVRYTSGMINLLMAYSMTKQGRFFYLSNEEVFSNNYDKNITESEKPSPVGNRAMAIAQGEDLCKSYRENHNADIVVVRIENYCSLPKDVYEVDCLCARMGLDAINNKTINYVSDNKFSMLYYTDAIILLYRLFTKDTLKSDIYNISSSEEISEKDLAEKISEHFGGENPPLLVSKDIQGGRKILSNKAYDEELRADIYVDNTGIEDKIISFMIQHQDRFHYDEAAQLPFWERFKQRFGWFIRALIPFIENFICFIPFFMLNNRAVGSEFFNKLDFYLLYVLLFAIVYGQQQATFSAVLSILGYCFRQMYDRSGFDVLLDYNTYVWVAQLFILGLVVGYMHDRIELMKRESEENKEYLSNQLVDIQGVNNSNVRVKDALKTQLINQQDSIGKIYKVTSSLEKYTPEEVLFYATEILCQLMESKDVAIYRISNSEYARLCASSSEKARFYGNSIHYSEFSEMYKELLDHKVYINRELDKRYPMMANAIFDNNEMQLIIMIWTLPWNNMTLGQANFLSITSSLIQNATMRAQRYLQALDEKRYLDGDAVMEPNAFGSLVKAYKDAKEKNLTEYVLVPINKIPEDDKLCKKLRKFLRQSDYIGESKEGKIYVLLTNTDIESSITVTNRLVEAGYQCYGNKEVTQ